MYGQSQGYGLTQAKPVAGGNIMDALAYLRDDATLAARPVGWAKSGVFITAFTDAGNGELKWGLTCVYSDNREAHEVYMEATIPGGAVFEEWEVFPISEGVREIQVNNLYSERGTI